MSIACVNFRRVYRVHLIFYFCVFQITIKVVSETGANIPHYMSLFILQNSFLSETASKYEIVRYTCYLLYKTSLKVF